MYSLSELAKEQLDFVTLVSTMPGLANILEVGLRQAIVPVMAQEASDSYSITKLNSTLKLHGGPVDKVLNLDRLYSLAPFKESFG